MARIRSSSHEVTTNFCGNCGVILAKSYAIFDKCPKCKETIEPWLDKVYAERVVRTIQENMYFWSVVAMIKVMHAVVSVKYHGKINRYEGLSRPSTVFFWNPSRLLFKQHDHTIKTVYLSNLPHNLATFSLVSIANAKRKNNNAGVKYSIIICLRCGS